MSLCAGIAAAVLSMPTPGHCGGEPRRRLYSLIGLGLPVARFKNFGAIAGRAPHPRQCGEVTLFYGSDDPLDCQVIDRRRHVFLPSEVSFPMPATCIRTRPSNWELKPK